MRASLRSYLRLVVHIKSFGQKLLTRSGTRTGHTQAPLSKNLERKVSKSCDSRGGSSRDRSVWPCPLCRNWSSYHQILSNHCFRSINTLLVLSYQWSASLHLQHELKLIISNGILNQAGWLHNIHMIKLWIPYFLPSEQLCTFKCYD